MSIRRNKNYAFAQSSQLRQQSETNYLNEQYNWTMMQQEPSQSEYSQLSKDQMIQKLVKKDRQIKKLINITQTYKKKIQQFLKYQEILKNIKEEKFNCSKNNQNQKQKSSQSEYTSKLYQQVEKSKATKLQKRIQPLFSISIFCEKQQPNFLQIQNSNSYQQFSSYFGSNLQRTVQRPSHNETKSGFKKINQKKLYEALIQSKKQNAKNSGNTSDSNILRYSCDSSQVDEKQNQPLHSAQRVPSLDNLRRIQKCFKLLKS